MLNYKLTTGIFLAVIAGLIITTQFVTISGWLFFGIACFYLLTTVYGSFVLSAQFFLPAMYKGSETSGAIAITFDDGPVPGNTTKAIDILKSHDAKATFFCIGNRVAAHPQLVQQMHDAGHLVANHSYWHKSTFDLQSAKAIDVELSSTNNVIKEVLGVSPRLFRPPYGVTNPMVAKAVRHGNFTTIGWSVRSFDTISKDSTVLLKRVTDKLKSGDIVLFHDYCSITLEILPAFLEAVAKKGLKVVRLDELLNVKAYG